MSEPQEKVDLSDLKETFLECPVCVEQFNQTDKRPRLLYSCLHAFCTQCLHQLLLKEGKNQITCPLCRQIQSVKENIDSLPLDPVRNKLVEYVRIRHEKKVPCPRLSSFANRHHAIVSPDKVLEQPLNKMNFGRVGNRAIACRKVEDAADKAYETEKVNADLRTSIFVEPVYLEAMIHLFGEIKLQVFCRIEDPGPYNKEIQFIVPPGREQEAQEFQLLAKNLCQEEIGIEVCPYTIPDIVMQDIENVYVKYQFGKKCLVIFACAWDKITEAKRRVEKLRVCLSRKGIHTISCYAWHNIPYTAPLLN